jgi:2-keto-myo-inositol isomerase
MTGFTYHESMTPILAASRLALNRIACPGLGLGEFLRLARSAGISKVELRNDRPGGRIHDELPAAEALALLEELGVQVITINALQHFNLGAMLPELERQMAGLARAARGLRCSAVVFCPHNDAADRRGEAERHREGLVALKRFRPILAFWATWSRWASRRVPCAPWPQRRR